MKVKPNIKRCRIDVGLSATAPYSAYWLDKYSDMLVIGLEPNPYNMERVKDGSVWIKNSPYLATDKSIVKMNGEMICDYNEKGNQFIGLEIAADDIEGIQKKKFYCTSLINTGCSSLLKPIDSKLNGVVTESEVEVDAAPLSLFLDNFPWEQIPIIDYLKTDTQGNDLNVVKSCGKYLKNICFVQCEWTTWGAYEGELEPNKAWQELNEYMQSFNFTPYYQSTTDGGFVNNELIPYIIEYGIKNDGFENQNGINFI